MTEEEFRNIVYPQRRDMLECAMRILQEKDDALDCIQDSLALLWKNRSRLKGVENIRGYCFVTVRNSALQILRNRRESCNPPTGELGTEESVLRRLEKREELDYLKRGLEGLPKMQREVIVLNAVKGLSNEEIAKVTGLTNTNVRTLLSRGRKTLKELYGNR